MTREESEWVPVVEYVQWCYNRWNWENTVPKTAILIVDISWLGEMMPVRCKEKWARNASMCRILDGERGAKIYRNRICSTAGRSANNQKKGLKDRPVKKWLLITQASRKEIVNGIQELQTLRRQIRNGGECVRAPESILYISENVPLRTRLFPEREEENE
jgi:hypothetical protein